MTQKKKKKSAQHIKKNAKRKEVQHVSKTMRFFQELQKYLFIGTLGLVVYVMFFMPVGTGSAPVDQGGNGAATTQKEQEIKIYSYLNSVKSARGSLTFDCEFELENGDNLKVESSKKFETWGTSASIKGSTIYNLNENAAVLDDVTYLNEGYRYEKAPSGYVKTAYKPLDGGNLNLGKIEDLLVKDDKLVQEDGVSCYKHTATITYGETSNELRSFIRNQGVNVADIDNLMLNITIFVTDTNLPYKIVVTFADAKCMIKANGLAAKNGVASGTLTIALNGFNGVERISLPAEVTGASEGTYAFSDKVNSYLNRTGLAQN